MLGMGEDQVFESHEPDGLSMRILAKPIPLDWREQREELGFGSSGCAGKTP